MSKTDETLIEECPICGNLSSPQNRRTFFCRGCGYKTEDIIKQQDLLIDRLKINDDILKKKVSSRDKVIDRLLREKETRNTLIDEIEDEINHEHYNLNRTSTPTSIPKVVIIIKGKINKFKGTV